MRKTPERGGLAAAILFGVLTAAGAGAFAAGMLGWHTETVWWAYLVNFVFWTSLAYGGIFFVTLCNLTNAKFSRPFKRLAEALGAFLPISLLLFIGLYFGRQAIFPWMHESIAHKQAWLNIPFLFGRELAAGLILSLLAFVLMGASIKNDRRFARIAVNGDSGGDAILQQAQKQRLWRLQAVGSPFFCILYVFILTMFSWDFVMMISTEWYSTLFGAFFFMSCFYAAIAAVFLIALLIYRSSDLAPYIGGNNFHALGKFMLGFLMVTADFYFSQHLLIWYGNLPTETRFVIERLYLQPWKSITLTVGAMIFFVPFVVLLSRRAKTSRWVMLSLSLLILAGTWLEDFLLIIPSLAKQGGLPLGLEAALISLGFLGLMGLSVLIYLRLAPWVPAGDPVFLRYYQLASRTDE